MRMITAVGQVVDRYGHGQHVKYGMNDDGTASRHVWSTALPPDRFAAEQPAHIIVDVDHDERELGEALYLERSAMGLDAVAVLDRAALLDALNIEDMRDAPPLFFSASVAGRCPDGPAATFHHGVRLDALGIVRATASVGNRPLQFFNGDVSAGIVHSVPINQVTDLLRRADTWCPRHRRYDHERAKPLPVFHAPNESRTTIGRPLATLTPAPARTPAHIFVPVRFDRVARVVVVDDPPPGRNLKRRPKLLWKGTGDMTLQPAARFIGEVGRALVFAPQPATIAGREALALVEDGMIVAAVPQRLADGSWSSLALVIT